jgi:hypothetical protein
MGGLHDQKGEPLLRFILNAHGGLDRDTSMAFIEASFSFRSTILKTQGRNLKYAEFNILLWVILDIFHQLLELLDGRLQFLRQFFVPDEGTRQPFPLVDSL